MKKTLLSIAMVLTSVAVASAAPVCTSGTLADYVALGSGGCTIGDKLFSNFSYASTAGGGASAVAANQVAVSPLVSVLDPGILFSSGGWTAFNGQFVDSSIAFDVTVLDPAFSLVGAELTIAGSKAGSSLGTVGETIVPPGGAGMTAILGINNHDTIAFGPVSKIHVLKDILVVAQPGAGNFASISAVSQRYNQTGSDVPEPGTMALMGSALAIVGLVYRKRNT